MSSQNRITHEVKRDAVAQDVDRGNAVSEVAERFGVRTCKIPSNLARRKSKPKKEILTPD